VRHSSTLLTTIALASLMMLVGVLVHQERVVATTLQDLQQAFVVNLETPHPVVGDVRVDGPIPHSAMFRMLDVISTPAAIHETTLWTDAGTVTTEGFTDVVVSIHGTLKGTVQLEGNIGVVLVPEEERILQSLAEGELHLPLEASAKVARGQANYFSGMREPLPIGFPNYRVFVYNGTDRTASVDLFVYLTN